MLLAESKKEQVFSIEEYFQLTDTSEQKYEFQDGKIIEMPGGNAVHNEIVLKIGAALLWALEEKKTNLQSL